MTQSYTVGGIEQMSPRSGRKEAHMRKPHLLRFDTIPVIGGAERISTKPLVSESIGATNVTTGVTLFPPKTELVLHSHNVDEQVTVVEGKATVQIGERYETMHPYDTTFVPAGLVHRFLNQSGHPMRILWVYTGIGVTRTLAATGETLGHLSGSDISGHT